DIRTTRSTHGKPSMSSNSNALVLPIKYTSVKVCSAPTSVCTLVAILGRLVKYAQSCLYSGLSSEVLGFNTRIMKCLTRSELPKRSLQMNESILTEIHP